MRLIDADELLKKEKTIHIEEVGYTHRSIDPLDVIEAPTVEAIPVEWVEEQKRKCVPHSITWLCLKELLVAWKEKENEHETD